MRLVVVVPMMCALCLGVALWGLAFSAPEAGRETAAGSAAVSSPSMPQSPGAGRLERQLLAEINALRAAHGLPAFRTSPSLVALARRESRKRALDDQPHRPASAFRPAPEEARQPLRGRLEQRLEDATVLPAGWLDAAASRDMLLYPRAVEIGVGVWRSRGYLLVTALHGGP